MSKISVALGGIDAGVALRAVGEIWRNPQLALAADFHSGDAFVPSFDYVCRAPMREVEGRASDGAIELLAGGQPAGVVDFHVVARIWRSGRCRP